MELLYIWIENYRDQFINREFNFGGSHLFRYKIESSEFSCIINNNHIKNFFHNDILNVSVIAGRNGSGKSLFIEMLLDLFAEGTGTHDGDLIAIGIQDNNFHIYCPNTRRRALNDCKELNKQNTQFLNSLKDFYLQRELIYYTNSFYDRINHFTTAGIINVSLKKLLHDSHRRDDSLAQREIPLMIRHRDQEQQRIIRLIIGLRKTVLNVSLPNYLVLKIDDSDEYYVRNSMSISDFVSEEIQKIRDFFSLDMRVDGVFKDGIALFKNRLLRALLFSTVKKSSNMGLLKQVVKNLNQENIEQIIELEFPEAYQLYQTVAEFIGESLVAPGNGTVAWIKIDENEERYTKFIELYFKSIDFQINYLSFGLSHTSGSLTEMSSGEFAYLSMFARLYGLAPGIQPFANLQIENNALLFIDEGELYFHPQWQQDFIQKLTEFIPQIFPRTKVQIFLTTHSPIILSDLPLSNVVFLSTEMEQETFRTLTEHEETFAANIYNLYKENFFLSKGTIGTFAQNKINGVIAFLKRNKYPFNEGETEDIRKTIEMIGEPIIKSKLIQMLEDKLSTSLIDLDRRMRKLENKKGNVE